MTLQRGARHLHAPLLAVLLLAAAMAGCIDSLTGDDSGDGDVGSGIDPGDGVALFIAALGDVPGAANGTLAQVGIKLKGSSASLFATLDETQFDLKDLATSEQALLAGVVEAPAGTVAETTLRFSVLRVGGDELTNAELTVPLEFAAEPGVEVTITLDLEATADAGELTLASLAADKAGTRLAAITGADLEAGERREVPPLPTPVIGATAVNATFPSFLVNTEINFTVNVPGVAPGDVREVFWAFGDGTTTTGLAVDHAFRAPGSFAVSVIVEGKLGQQARATEALDVFQTFENMGNIGIGLGGTGTIPGRDVKDEPLDLVGPLSSIAARVAFGGPCVAEAGQCLPTNVHVQLLDPDGNVLVEDTTDANPKWLNLTQELPTGEHILRLIGDTGVAIGYQYLVEVHYLGLPPMGAPPPSDEP